MKYLLFVAILVWALISLATPSQQCSLSNQNNSEKSIVVQAVAPKYPVLAAVAGVSGTVTVEAQINNQGEVISTKSTDGHKLLCKAAEDASRTWKFNFGDNKSHTITISYTFALMSKSASSNDLGVSFIYPYHVEIRDIPPELTTEKLNH